MNLSTILLEAYQILFEASVDAIYTTYYSDVDRSDFDKINQADPTSKNGRKKGRYLSWLMKLFKNDNLKFEDLYKATEYLKIYSRYGAKTEQPDINKIESLPELFKVIEPIQEKLETGNVDEIEGRKAQRSRGREEIEEVYEDDTWKIVIPKTERASCVWGSNTKWCTAADSENNKFNDYNREGNLYIAVNKKTGEKYQFHKERNEYKDKTNSSIDPTSIGLPKKILAQMISLNYATYTKDPEIVKLVIASGSKPDIDTLNSAVLTENLEIVKLVIAVGAEPNSRTLNYALRTNIPEIIKLVIDLGAKPKHDTLNYAIKTNNLEIIKLAVDLGAKPDINTLNYAVTTKNPEMIRLAVDLGAEPNYDTLDYAVKTNNPEIVKFAIDLGAKPDINTLNYAVRTNNPEIVKFVIDIGAKLNDETLDYAMITNDLEMVKFVMNLGARTNIYDLHDSIKRKNPEMVKLFIDAGVKPDEDALEIAEKMGNKDIINMIKAML